jgi:type II protein arginine methyltransferase
MTNEVEQTFQLAVGHFEAGRCHEAEALLARLAPGLSNEPDFQRLRGLVAARLKDGARALEHLRRAVALAPASPVNQFELAEQLRRSGNLAEAERHFRQSVALDGAALAPRLALARILQRLGRATEVRAELQRAREIAGDKPDDLIKLAMAARDLAQTAHAVHALRRFLELVPGHFEAEALLRDLQTSQVRPWHFRMMNDRPRNQAYDAALRRAINPDSHVLEIGTGSGLLALMAARAGAALVTTCEMVEIVAEAAADIVRRNGYGDRVKVIPKKSTELQVGVDLPRPADVLLSEILGDRLLSEDVLRSTADARRRLTRPDAILIPRGVSAIARLVGGEFFAEAVSVSQVEGFDLTPFNRFTPSTLSISMESGAFDSLSDDVEAFRFDLREIEHRPGEARLQFNAHRAGTCLGVLQWLRLQLHDDIVFENAPAERIAPSAWRQVFHPFASPIEVQPGDRVAVRAKHDLSNLAFALERRR